MKKFIIIKIFWKQKQQYLENIGHAVGRTVQEKSVTKLAWFWKLNFKTFFVLSIEVWSCLLNKYLLLHFCSKLVNKKMFKWKNE